MIDELLNASLVDVDGWQLDLVWLGVLFFNDLNGLMLFLFLVLRVCFLSGRVLAERISVADLIDLPRVERRLIHFWLEGCFAIALLLQGKSCSRVARQASCQSFLVLIDSR
jgi:hypothetical protein